MRIGMKEMLSSKISEHLTGVYHCTRVWDAWLVGTMGEEDFEPASESNLAGEIAEDLAALIEKECGVEEMVESLNEFVEKFEHFEDRGSESGTWQSESLEMMIVRAKVALSKFKGAQNESH